MGGKRGREWRGCNQGNNLYKQFQEHKYSRECDSTRSTKKDGFGRVPSRHREGESSRMRIKIPFVGLSVKWFKCRFALCTFWEIFLIILNLKKSLNSCVCQKPDNLIRISKKLLWKYFKPFSNVNLDEQEKNPLEICFECKSLQIRMNVRGIKNDQSDTNRSRFWVGGG